MTFSRDGPEGQIAYGGCLADDVSAGCSEVTGNSLFNPVGAAISRDRASVYVVSSESH